MNLIFILSCLFNIQGKEPYLYDFIQKKKKKDFGFNLDIYKPILSNLEWW